ncbi:MAG: hypothetical protein LBU81_00465 [Methanosarcinales archaeon]|jgi:hypothetical protein|nr:hypothetical protein [Methanosarcinales archaeon]
MLETHLDDKNKAVNIAQALNTSYYHHGYAVGRKEAKDIGLEITYPDQELESIMWSIWLDFCDEMKCNQSFDPISEIMNDSTANRIISQVPIVSIPANTPPQVAQNLIGQIAQQQAKIVQQPSLEISQPLAAIESFKNSYVFKQQLNVVFWRDANMGLSYNMTGYSKGWEKVSTKEM